MGVELFVVLLIKIPCIESSGFYSRETFLHNYSLQIYFELEIYFMITR